MRLFVQAEAGDRTGKQRDGENARRRARRMHDTPPMQMPETG
jgi:hypothetical protein